MMKPVAEQALHDEEGYRCVPATNGLAVIESKDQGYILPNPESQDLYLRQPKLPIQLSVQELEELLHPHRPAAVTHYGPDERQDKASNQDFALSALIQDGNGDSWSFAAVADGVSTKTFWPERASRVACLVAYKFFRSQIRQGRLVQEDSYQHLRGELAQALKESLEKDRDALHPQSRTVIPPTYSASAYQERIDDRELWYNTTLLISLFGPKGGLVYWAGDGGVWLRKTKSGGTTFEPEEQPLRSGTNVAILDFVSLAVQGGDFKALQISTDGWKSVALFLASDGLDRTLDHKDANYGCLLPEGPTDPEADRKRLQKGIDQLAQDEKAENDNTSLALCTWPPPKPFQAFDLPAARALNRLGANEPEASPGPGTEPTPVTPEPLLGSEPAGATLAHEAPLPPVRSGSRRDDQHRAVKFVAVGLLCGFVLGFLLRAPREARRQDSQGLDEESAPTHCLNLTSSLSRGYNGTSLPEACTEPADSATVGSKGDRYWRGMQRRFEMGDGCVHGLLSETLQCGQISKQHQSSVDELFAWPSVVHTGNKVHLQPEENGSFRSRGASSLGLGVDDVE